MKIWYARGEALQRRILIFCLVFRGIPQGAKQPHLKFRRILSMGCAITGSPPMIFLRPPSPDMEWGRPLVSVLASDKRCLRQPFHC